ncbi:MAG: HNH endonuclease [Deltaproteobacteria bacterium]|nr:MAG: HNH endonuclease [Deltaproteobacteria bacterium]
MNASAHTPTSETPPTTAWLERRDDDLAALARGAGALRLALGDGLALLRRTGGAAELGFPSLGAYALERLGRTRRWAEDTAGVAERLRALPRTRDALARGHLAWSKAELLARSANQENEAELLELAHTHTVRAMRATLIARAAGLDDALAPTVPPTPDDAPEDERCVLQVTVDRVTAWAFEATRRFVDAHAGVASDEVVVEALLAEGLSTLRDRHPGLTIPPRPPGAYEPRHASDERERRLADLEADLLLLGRLPELDEHFGELVAEHLLAPPRDPVALDAHLRDLNTQLQSRDRRLGALARRFWDARGWDHLGYPSAAHYARERLGCSLAALKERITLDRRCATLPAVAEALDTGRIGFEAARLLSRVARPDTVGSWLERAAERTVKHLREDVEAVQCFARVDGVASAAAPPDDATVEAYLALQRVMLDGTVADLVVNGQLSGDADEEAVDQVSGDADAGATGQMSGDAAPGQMSGAGWALAESTGAVPLRLRLTAELAALWQVVSRAFRRSGEPGDFLDFLIRTFWHVWLRRDPDRVAYQDVYERERHRCASPVCDNRDLTPHHLRFRSRGGGDERSNLVGLCVTCHIELLHQGRLRAEPPADDIRWTLGRTALLVVRGRTLVAAGR